MKPILLTTFVLITTLVLGQVPTNFNRIVCAGEMPIDFKTGFSDRYLSDLHRNDVESNLSSRDAQEFAVLTNHTNHTLLMGGSVLYGDKVSNFANDILTKLLVKDTTLRNELRVYTVKSNQVNAYSTNQGIIFITLGLIAKLQNEAQLAYVLAHEVSHYTNRHVLQSFENHKEIYAKGGSYSKFDDGERNLTAFKYSREAEFEADKEGLEYYMAAGYDVTQIYEGFDILLHGDLAIKEKGYSWSKIENDSFRLSEYYLIDSCAPISSNDNVNDELLTHPNIQKRKQALKQVLQNDSMSSKGQTHLVKTHESFIEIRDLARFEMTNSFLRKGQYAVALYHIQMLLDEYHDHPFLLRAELMCWYGMQKMINNQQKKIYSSGYRKIEGQEQAVHYFFGKMTKRGMNVLATKFVWEQTEGMEQDSFVITIRRQSLSQLGEAVKSDYLLLEYPTEDLNDDNSKNKKRPKNVDFVRIAFVELFKNESFKKQYDAVFGISHVDEQVEDESEEEQEVLITDNYVQGVSSYYGLSNVDRLLYLSPKFFRIDLSKELDQRLLSSDREQTDLHNRTERLSKMAGIDLIMLDKPDAENRNTEIFNDFSQIQDWIREESLYNGRCFYSFSSQALPQIRETYGTDYLGINYVSHFTERNPFNGGYLILSLITFYPLPLYLYWQLKPLHNLEYNFAVFDLKEGDIGFYDIKSFSARYKKGTINAHLYNSFNQLNRQR